MERVGDGSFHDLLVQHSRMLQREEASREDSPGSREHDCGGRSEAGRRLAGSPPTHPPPLPVSPLQPLSTSKLSLGPRWQLPLQGRTLWAGPSSRESRRHKTPLQGGGAGATAGALPQAPHSFGVGASQDVGGRTDKEESPRQPEGAEEVWAPEGPGKWGQQKAEWGVGRGTGCHCWCPQAALLLTSLVAASRGRVRPLAG